MQRGRMSTHLLLAFCGVALIAYVTPGPDWFVVMRHAASSRRAGVVAALGVQTGLVVHLTAAAVGVAAVLLSSAEAFTALKIAGAAYLVFLGAQALLRSRRSIDRVEPDGHEGAVGLLAVYREATVANVLNPKAALFFVAVLPQFVSPAHSVAVQVLVLGGVDIVLGLVWWAVFVVGIGRIGSVLGHRRSRVVVDRTAGVALIGLGGVLALADPPLRR